MKYYSKTYSEENVLSWDITFIVLFENVEMRFTFAYVMYGWKCVKY